jgi:hypothetical protein
MDRERSGDLRGVNLGVFQRPPGDLQSPYNMKRMINIFGVNPLMQAIAA